MRCDQCNIFVETDSDIEPELELSFSFNDKKNVVVEGTCRIVNACAQCGTELQEHEFQIYEEFDMEHEEGCSVSEDDEPIFEDPTVDRTDWYVPPKAKRQKHMYGVNIDIEATCEKCRASTGQVFIEDGIQSSMMDSLV